MRVLGCVCPSMPMRTPLTPAAPTAMRVCPVAITVSGKSTTTRAGESRVLSFGFGVPLELISTWMLSVLRTTLTRSSWLGVCALAATTKTSNDTNCVSCCFRISPLPPAGLARVSFVKLDFDAPGFRSRRSCLNRRSNDSLHHFPRERLAQLVLDRLLEHHRVSRDLHHVAVKHRIVFPQKICLVQIVGHHCDEARIGPHHAPQIDRANLQALLSGGASRAVGLNDRAEERIAFPAHRPLLLFRLGRLGSVRILGRSRCGRGHGWSRDLLHRGSLGYLFGFRFRSRWDWLRSWGL